MLLMIPHRLTMRLVAPWVRRRHRCRPELPRAAEGTDLLLLGWVERLRGRGGLIHAAAGRRGRDGGVLLLLGGSDGLRLELLLLLLWWQLLGHLVLVMRRRG